MKQDSQIFLSIGGFIVSIVFAQTEYAQRRVLMEELIRERYKVFLTSNATCDFTISFIYTAQMSALFHPKGKEVYISLFKRKEKTHILTSYHISLFQLDLILTNVVQDLLLTNEGFIFHASSVRLKSGVVLFMERSGGGKSTAATLLSKKYPLFSDDNIIVRKQKQSYFAYQMPLLDKQHAKASSVGYPVKAVFFLQKSLTYKVARHSEDQDIFNKLLGQLFSRSTDVRKEIKSLRIFFDTYKHIYLLSFAKNRDRMVELLEQFNT